LAEIGTIAQVLAYKEENETNEVRCHIFCTLLSFRTTFQLISLKMRAIGRQRFKLIETRRQLDGLAMFVRVGKLIFSSTLIGSMKIMPEYLIEQPLRACEPPSWRHHASPVPRAESITTTDAFGPGRPHTFKVRSRISQAYVLWLFSIRVTWPPHSLVGRGSCTKMWMWFVCSGIAFSIVFM
jgi:hypothetical protein